jgi:hypothetical protein
MGSCPYILASNFPFESPKRKRSQGAIAEEESSCGTRMNPSSSILAIEICLRPLKSHVEAIATA